MDTIEKYREIIRGIVTEYAGYTRRDSEIESEAIIDTERDHYELIRIGWQGQQRVHGVVFHLDIIDGKIWIQYDGTSPGIAEELVEADVPREDIVLGFRPAHLRQYSGFATA